MPNFSTELQETESGVAELCGHRESEYFKESLLQRFLQLVDQKPNEIALIEGSTSGQKLMSFSELNRRANALVASLQQKGCRKNSIVAVVLKRSFDLVASVLAVWKLQACYFPIDTLFPPAYQKKVLDLVGANIVITQEERSEFNLPTIHLAKEELSVSREPRSSYPYEHHNAILMLTSGTTSAPKAVLHSPRQITNRLHWMWRAYPFKKNDVLAARSSISVMPSMWELLGGVCHGVPTVLLDNEVLQDPKGLLQSLRTLGITFITIATPLLRVLLQQGDPCENLRVVITGGTALTLETVKQFQKQFPTCLLVDDFGMTETNTILHRCFYPNDHYDVLPGFIPIDNVCVRAASQKSDSIGKSNLIIRGDALFVGYLPDVTLLKTQHISDDLAAIDCNNKAVIVYGRDTNFVKVSGFSVQLEQVEAEISRLVPEISEIVVSAKQIPGEEFTLIATVVLKNARWTAIQLIQHCAKQLPHYLVPSEIKIVNALPKLLNGKVDRLTLASQPIAKGLSFNEFDSVLDRLITVLNLMLDRKLNNENIHTPFVDLGLNSLQLMQFVQKINECFNAQVKVTDLFDHCNLHQCAQFLRGENSPKLEAVQDQKLRDQEIVITGYSGLFPSADTVDAFGELLSDGRTAVANADSRIDWQLSSPASAYLLTEIEYFDHDFFGIPNNEADYLDPQLRLLLQEVVCAIEASGHSPLEWSGRSVGVYVGAQPGEYFSVRRHQSNSRTIQLQNDFSFLASQIAYCFHFTGPSLAIDTACSSSFVALQQAFHALQRGDIEYAVVAGVSIKTTSEFYRSTEQLGVLSKRSQCAPFSAEADGFVLGEAVSVVILRRKQEAIADRDTVYAELKAVEVRQEGRTNGLASPSSAAQQELIYRCYQRNRIDAGKLTYYETHGTATKLGDAIEIKAMQAAFKNLTPKKNYCPIGSVKANVGHSTAASGLVSLCKILQNFEQGVYPALAHYTVSNEEIELTGSPFYVPTKEVPFTDRSNQLVGISSFGMSGVITHAVIAGPPEESASLEEEQGPLRYWPILISAKSPQSLTQRIENWIKWLKSDRAPSSTELIHLSFTSLCGLTWFQHRVVLVARNRDELLRSLVECAPLECSPRLSHQPSSFTAEQIGELKITDKKSAEQLASTLLKHNYVNCAQLFKNQTVHRCRLPKYCFDFHYHWIPLEPEGVDKATEYDSIKEIIKEIYHLSQIESSMTLQQLGYDSINLLALQTSIEQHFDCKLPLAYFTGNRTVAEIETAIHENMEERYQALVERGDA